MKRSLALCVAVGLVAVACGGSQPSGTSTANTVKVGFILPGTTSDPWTDAMYIGSQAIARSDTNVQTKVVLDVADPTQAEPIVRQLIASGYKVIVLHNFTFDDLVKKLAAEFPKVVFAESGFITQPPPNVHIYTLSNGQYSYVNCWLLAKLTKTGTIGVISAVVAPYSEDEFTGCQLGAMAANPNAKVIRGLTGGDYVDQAKYSEQAQLLVNQGADGIYPAEAEIGVVGAYTFCEQHSVICTGLIIDNRDVAPNTMVNSVVLDWKGFLQKWIGEARSGQFQGGTDDATFQNGILTVTPFGGPSSSKVPSDVQTAFKAMVADMIAGKIQLPQAKAHPCCP